MWMSFAQASNVARTAEACGKPQSAEAFFEPLREGVLRPAFCPQALQITEVPVSEKEFRKKLVGVWKKVFHCDGAPLSAKFFQLFSDKADGYYNPAEIKIFDGKTYTKYITQPISKQKDPTQAPPSQVKTGVVTAIDTLPNNAFKIHYSNLQDSTYRVVYIAATNETLLQSYPSRKDVLDDSEEDGDDDCPSGNPVKTLWVPVSAF